jgi:2-polyprenyl-3-methyl-5-hydroxy-6-metoxy-1,4-benzoquinol methylase
MVDEQLAWESCACDWCGSNESELVFVGPDRLEKLPGEFRMVRCTQCGLFRQDPRLAWSSLKDYYIEGYASFPSLVKEQKSWLKRLDKRYGPWKRLRAIERYKPGGRLLEIGCATGYFLEEVVRSKRWEALGIEPNAWAANYSQDKLGVRVLNGRFAETDLPRNSFDVIAMWNVLEHLDHPIVDLRYAYDLLKEGGLLVMAIPNMEGLEAKIFHKYWVGWDLPRHLYLFPQQTLGSILSAIGFEVIDRRCISTSYSVLGHTLDFWSQSWGNKFESLRKVMLTAYHNPIARLGLGLPLGILDRLNLSTIITIFAQKEVSEKLLVNSEF